MKKATKIIIPIAAVAVVAAATITTIVIVNNNNNKNNASNSSSTTSNNTSSPLWSKDGISISQIGMSFVGSNSCNITMTLANNTDKDYELDMKKFEFKLDNGYTFQLSSTWTLSANHPYIYHGANFGDDVVKNLKAGDTVHVYFEGKELTTITIKDENSGTGTSNEANALSESTNTSIVGKWQYGDQELTNAGANFIYTFNTDGTGNYNAAGTDMKFTYTTNGNKISIVYDGGGTFDTEYEINGDTLNVKDSGGNDTLYKKVK